MSNKNSSTNSSSANKIENNKNKPFIITKSKVALFSKPSSQPIKKLFIPSQPPTPASIPAPTPTSIPLSTSPSTPVPNPFPNLLNTPVSMQPSSSFPQYQPSFLSSQSFFPQAFILLPLQYPFSSLPYSYSNPQSSYTSPANPVFEDQNIQEEESEEETFKDRINEMMSKQQRDTERIIRVYTKKLDEITKRMERMEKRYRRDEEDSEGESEGDLVIDFKVETPEMAMIRTGIEVLEKKAKVGEDKEAIKKRDNKRLCKDKDGMMSGVVIGTTKRK